MSTNISNTVDHLNLSIVAFMDVLGFKDLIHSDNGQRSYIDVLYAIRQENMKTFTETTQHEQKGNFSVILKPNISSYSDHIVLTVPLYKSLLAEHANPIVDFHLTLNTAKSYISTIQRKLLMLGMLLRGSIAIGEVYCDIDNNIIVGKPLVEAVESESKKAVFPRVILSPSLIDFCNNLHPPFPPHQTIFTKDIDELYFVNYMEDQILFSSENGLPGMNFIGTLIKNKLNQFQTNISVYEKWIWLAKVYDNAIDRFRSQIHWCTQIQNIL